ncbi:MAG: hypothetical protein Ct9H90mP5_11320 [Acidimicrobiaceae bacterium]|nr:MAG: hypothetical protein Ct9H90mP5_11320 [Acidimicrobiaceae bacterium]
MIHGVEISNGKANWYRNRYFRTPMFDNPDKERMELYLDREKGGAFNYEVSVANTSFLDTVAKFSHLGKGPSFPYDLGIKIRNFWGFTIMGQAHDSYDCPP